MTSEKAERNASARMLLPGEAALLVDLVRACYGDHYLEPDIYDVDRVASRLKRGELVAVAIVEADRAMASMSLGLRSGRRVAEVGMTVVRPEARGRGFARLVASEVGRQALRRRLQGLIDLPVTVHGATQRLGREAGSYCGYLVGNVPSDLSFGMSDRPPGRSSSLVRYLRLRRGRHRDVYMPRRHIRLAGRIYAEAQLRRTIVTEDAHSRTDVSFKTTFCERRDRLTVEQTTHSGTPVRTDDVAHHLDELIEQHRPAVVHLDIALDTPAAAAIAARARSRGLYFAAILPELALGGDVLRLQRVTASVAPRATVDKDARFVCAAVAADRDAVSTQYQPLSGSPLGKVAAEPQGANPANRPASPL